MLTAMDAHGARNVLVTTAAGATGTSVTLTFTAR
jgi:hypothetical protein